jgi:signal transduction histidine kinase
VEDAIAVNKPLFEGTQVQIIREFSCDKIILIDRVKLLHIIVNLIKNSIESVLATHDTNKIITVRTEKHDETHIAIQIIDNGVGVPEENLEKIFSFGFTTKKTGHGFGMHTSANFTTEVGGKLVAESLGVNQGATMTLILPVAPEKKVKNTSDTSSHANAL